VKLSGRMPRSISLQATGIATGNPDRRRDANIAIRRSGIETAREIGLPEILGARDLDGLGWCDRPQVGKAPAINNPLVCSSSSSAWFANTGRPRRDGRGREEGARPRRAGSPIRDRAQERGAHRHAPTTSSSCCAKIGEAQTGNAAARSSTSRVRRQRIRCTVYRRCRRGRRRVVRAAGQLVECRRYGWAQFYRFPDFALLRRTTRGCYGGKTGSRAIRNRASGQRRKRTSGRCGGNSQMRPY
jgi:hypothetical protein